jgi:TM2 domain-containing membrane protein YozV
LRRLLLIISFSLLIPAVLFASENFQSRSQDRKNPFLAGIFSWYHPGLGQFYVGETRKATLFWITENVLFFSLVLNIADIKIGIKRDIGFEFSIKLKKNPSTLRIASTVGLGLLLIAVHIYNIIDAINSAQEYNQKMFAREFELSQKNFSIESFANRDVNGLQIVQRF